MKKFALLFYITSSLFASEEGEVAVTEAIEYAKSSEWQNVIFAGIALATITAGVIVVSLDQGSDGSSH